MAHSLCSIVRAPVFSTRHQLVQQQPIYGLSNIVRGYRYMEYLSFQEDNRRSSGFWKCSF